MPVACFPAVGESFVLGTRSTRTVDTAQNNNNEPNAAASASVFFMEWERIRKAGPTVARNHKDLLRNGDGYNDLGIGFFPFRNGGDTG